MSTNNVTWTANGQPIGDSVTITTTCGDNYELHIGDTTSGGINDPLIWTTSPSTVGPMPMPPVTPLPVEPEGEDRNKVVTAPPPSLESILIEIAKVLRDGGDILEVREIFERHKLKLVDHDGEVIFDPKDVEKLEDRGL